MSAIVPASSGSVVVERLATDITAAAAWLSDLDGAIGDGDHGVNLRHGFDLVRDRLEGGSSIADALRLIGTTLLEDVGGAMGPLYGVFFLTMASEADGHDFVNLQLFAQMLERATLEVTELGGAQPGDKTLIDVLHPASTAVSTSVSDGADFGSALEVMADTAERARDSTRAMMSRVGRSSRMAERSIGHVDAGAASCAVILRSLATSFRAEFVIQQ